MGRIKDLTGQRFSRLVVIQRTDDYIDKNGKRHVKWLCQCDCGNIHIASSGNLSSGNVRSCGCLSREILSRSKNLRNKYDLSGEYGIGYTDYGEEFYFDLEDYDLIKDYHWYYDKTGYVISRDRNGKTTWMHRLVLGLGKATPNGLVADHIHGINTINDNRKSNLRIADKTGNSINKRRQSNNLSGVPGVSWDKFTNKWRAYYQINGKQYALGRFDSMEEAIKTRKEAEDKYFGEWSYDNSQKYVSGDD